MLTVAGLGSVAVLSSMPRWLLSAVVALRERIFIRVNGVEGIPVPGPLVGAGTFSSASTPTRPPNGRGSRGAGLSDLFWYWLAPGPQMHQEHLEPGERYRAGAARPGQVLAVPSRTGPKGGPWRPAATGAGSRRVAGRPDRPHATHVICMMPVWAEVYFRAGFRRIVRPPSARALIVANADDVVTALKEHRTAAHGPA